MSDIRRPFHIPFWFWLITLVVIVTAWLGYGEIRDHRARARLQATLEQYQREGQGVFMEDLLPELPVIDEARQEQAWRWMRAWNSTSAYKLKTSELDDLIDGRKADAPEWRKQVVEQKRLLDEWTSLHHSGLVCLDVRGWLKQDMASAKDFRGPDARIVPLMGMRNAAWVMRARADLSDSLVDLGDFDALVEAIHGGTAIDAMIRIAIAKERDRTYLDLIRLDRLSKTDRERWITEKNDDLVEMANAFHCERIFWSWLIKLWDREGSAAIRVEISGVTGSPTWREQMMNQAQEWGYLMIRPVLMPMPEDIRIGLDQMRCAERRLRGEAIPQPPIPDGAILSRIALPNLLACWSTAVMRQTEAHRLRLAARIVIDSRDHGLPANEAELCQRLGAACLDVPRGPRQAYARIDAKRFRLFTTTGGENLPTWFDVKDITASKPTPKDRRSVFDSWSCEIELHDPPAMPTTRPSAPHPSDH